MQIRGAEKVILSVEPQMPAATRGSKLRPRFRNTLRQIALLSCAIKQNVNRSPHAEHRQLMLLLRRGQMGTVVMTYDGSTFEVEFADRDGRAYAILPVRAEKLIRLRDSTEPAVASLPGAP